MFAVFFTHQNCYHLVLACFKCMRACQVTSVRLFVTPWTVAHQAPLSVDFSRQEYWSRFPCPPPVDLPDSGIEPAAPALQADSLLLSHWGSTQPASISVWPPFLRLLTSLSASSLPTCQEHPSSRPFTCIFHHISPLLETEPTCHVITSRVSFQLLGIAHVTCYCLLFYLYLFDCTGS